MDRSQDSSSWQRIWQLSWPIMLSNMTMPLVGATDVAMMGHLSDPALVGGVALGSLLFNFFYMGFGFLRMGTTGFVAQCYGSRDTRGLQLILARSLMLAAGLGGALILLAPLLILAAVGIFSADQAVEAHMDSYVRWRILAAPAALANMVLLGWLYGVQAMRLAMLQLVFVNLANIGLNFWLVFGLDTQIEGVALASAGAQWLGLVLTVFLVRRHLAARFGLRFTLRLPGLFGGAGWTGFLLVGRDITVRTMLLLLAEAVLVHAAAAQGVAELGAMKIVLVLFSLIAFGLDGFAHAGEALAGSAIGQRDRRMLNLVVWRSCWLAAAAGLFMTLIIVTGAGWIIPLLTSQPLLQEATHQVWLWAAVLPLASFLAFQMDGIFVGAALGREMRDAMIASVLFFAGLLWIIGMDSLDGLLASFNLYLVMRGLVLLGLLGRVRALAG